MESAAVESSLVSAQRAMSRLVLDVPDYPQPGIVFKDITPVLGDPAAFQAIVDALANAGRDNAGAVVVDKVIGMEARGFILAAPVALALDVGFVPVRKQGRLPRATHAVSYDLEYGSATLEIHQDAITVGERVLLIDDVLATGGTAAATVTLIQACGGIAYGLGVLIELGFLPGRQPLNELPVTALTVVS